MIVADASWVIALRDPCDPHHDAATRMNLEALDEGVLLHPVTFAECLVGPAMLDRLEEAAAGLRAAVEVTDLDREAPLRWARLRASSGLRLPDAIVLDTALSHGARTVLTFDQRLADVAADHGIEVHSPDP